MIEITIVLIIIYLEGFSMIYSVNDMKENIEKELYKVFEKADTNHNRLIDMNLGDIVTNLETMARQNSSRLDEFITHIRDQYINMADMMYSVPIQYVSDIVLNTLDGLDESILSGNPFNAYDKTMHVFRNKVNDMFTSSNRSSYNIGYSNTLYASHVTEVFKYYYNEYCKTFKLSPIDMRASDFANITDAMFITILLALDTMMVCE